MSMTPARRRELYLALAESPVYRPRYKYEELTAQEAQEIIDFLRGRTKQMPAVLFDNSTPFPARYRAKDAGDNAETEQERDILDRRFQEAISALSIDDIMRIGRCREILNELSHAGIHAYDLKSVRKELEQVLHNAADIDRQTDEMRQRYQSLKQLSYAVSLAENPKYTHGPLFDEKEQPAVQQEFTDIPTRESRPRDTRSVLR